MAKKDIIKDDIGVIIWYGFECGDSTLIIVDKKNYRAVYDFITGCTCDIRSALDVLDERGIDYQVVLPDSVYEHVYEADEDK
jgi:hypothetical protein